MENTIITEFVKFQALETTTDKQLLSIADININTFHKKQDGFIDAELIKDVEENGWCFIFHYESLEKIKAVGEKLRASKEFGEFVSHVVPESIRVTFYYQLRTW